MSTAATMAQPPIPPRPTRSADQSNSNDLQPKIPPRPTKRFDRSISPNPDRFAPSPLNEPSFSKSPRTSRSNLSANYGTSEEPIQRPGSVNLPSLGEEGHEYAAVHNDAASPPSSPGQTRLVSEDLKLHAPKPSFPAQTSKQRVQAVTRTDSDKAASFGIGRPSSEELPDRSYIRKKRSSIAGQSETDSAIDDEEHGIPEIGQRVPMNPHLGDVQAPSPAPQNHGSEGNRSQTPRHHHRKHSSRGFSELPPGSYGLHGHGTPQPADKLEKAWYDKHPDHWKKESQVSLHDRQNDFAMSSTDLNKIVRETHDAGLGTSPAYAGTPSEEVGYQASEEYTQRISSRPGSAAPRSPELHRASPALGSSAVQDEVDEVIHVDASHNRSRSFLANPSEENLAQGEEGYHAPILASDEVAKNPHYWDQQPAVEADRRGSFYEDGSSRPTSRPGSLYHNNGSNVELSSTPLEDVEEYEPLFPEDEEKKKKAEAEGQTWQPRHKFPSKDVWEDAPESVNATAEVSTPDLFERQPRRRTTEDGRSETPAQAFARHQEELAEKESRESENFRRQAPTYLPLQQIKSNEERPKAQNRFPSRDIWEDTPESLMHETTVDTPESEQAPAAASKPQVPARPQKKLTGDGPVVPERPRPSQTPSDEAVRQRPSVSDKPKPQIPARPTKTLPSGIDSKEQDSLPRQKPAVPARPTGSKIQALQAGFMSDLNKRLQLGPQAPKKEEPPAADTIEEKEQKPLADARKGRARGPQRRAPAARSPAPVKEHKSGAPVLSFSPLRTCWSIGDSGVLEIDSEKPAPEAKVTQIETKSEPEAVPEAQPAADEALRTEAEPEKVEATAPESIAPEPQAEPQIEAQAETKAQPEETSPEPTEEVKTLASNTAGESILEAKVEETKDEVEPVSVEATGGDKA